MDSASKSVLALDVGSRRIGVALADTLAKLAHPLTTIERSDESLKLIKDLCKINGAVKLIVGLPRGLDGQTTAQTQATLAFVEQLKAYIDLPLQLQDEALTSVAAEKELSEGKGIYSKADVDALAAAYILDDYLSSETEPSRA
jgi:putative Holliday junction resolvase